MKYLIAALVIGALVGMLLLRRRSAERIAFEPLDVSGREDRSAEAFYRAFYADAGLPKASVPDIRAVLHAVAKASGLAAGKLEPADELGAIAAANGLSRAFLIAQLGVAFPEAQAEMMQKTAAGDFTKLHHAIALVVNARGRARNR
ncbi:MAG: hypothetical protein AMJ64_03465 [Betaproteobacteria bacterium SG8_39]|nr:MAG: hypothetical protein AMJ64_03465 [Betaproteobacteria bacterium SG8_39]